MVKAKAQLRILLSNILSTSAKTLYQSLALTASERRHLVPVIDLP